MTRANRSPKKPRNLDRAMNPGSETSPRIDLGVFIWSSYYAIGNQDRFFLPRNARRHLLQLPRRDRFHANDPLESAKSRKSKEGFWLYTLVLMESYHLQGA